MTASEIQISYNPPKGYRPTVNCSAEAYELLIEHYPTETIQLQEHFVIMHLNRANKVIGIHKLSSGGITSTIADIRILLAVALKSMATAIIISHNHPSGVLKPSQADINLTQKIKEAAALLDIELLDHLIVSSEGFYSFTQEGKIEFVK
jgi:DNA repair protein RadC